MKNKIIAIIAVLILVVAGTFILFPKTGNAISNGDSLISIRVLIPCSGHAYLIENALTQTQGIAEVKFKAPNYFDISYDSAKISKQEILSLDIFKQYQAEVQK